jgi:sugar phosphate isomerase/epimerase
MADATVGYYLDISWENDLRLSVVHIMLYPDIQPGEQRFIDTVATLAKDDFFTFLELQLIKDPAQRKAIGKLADTSHLSIAYIAPLLRLKLDVNSLDKSERDKAVKEVKSSIDEAVELGAERVMLLSGPDPGAPRRNDATRVLIDSLKEICAYAEEKHMGVTLEAMDRDVEKKCLIGPARDAAALARAIRKDYRNFGILYDMAHGPLLEENPRSALAVLKDYLVQIHVGNCVKVVGNPAYGDRHPRFGVDGGMHDVGDLTRFLKILFDIGYLRKKTRQNEKLPIVGLEVSPMPGESSEAVLAGAKRVWRQAWAQLQIIEKNSKR